MTQEIEEFLQAEYEDILAEYWPRVLNLRELEETNLNNNSLRLMSIRDRQKELEHTKTKIKALEYLYSDWIEIPRWFKDICKKHNIEEIS